MEKVPENGKESSHSTHKNGMNEWIKKTLQYTLIVLCWWIYVLKRFTVLESVVNNGFSITF